MKPDLEKLRRFALVIGLLLITYSLAAVELDTGETIRPLGLPLKVNRSEYLGIALVIASLWGAARFLYYGVWKTESPPGIRNPMLKQLRNVARSKPKWDPQGVKRYVGNLEQLFPRLPGLRITVNTTPEYPGDDRVLDDKTLKARDRLIVERVNIPWPFYVATWIEDADYFAPIWLNVVALGLWLRRYLLS